MTNHPSPIRQFRWRAVSDCTAALLTVILFVLTLTRAAANPSSVGDDSSLPRTINMVGFRAWASMFDFPGANFPGADVAVSPPAIWYLDEFTGRHFGQPDRRTTATLDGLIGRARLSGAIHFNGDKAALTASDTAAAHAWRASTSATPTDGSDILVDVSFGETFAFPADPQRKIPFFSDGGLRAVRFDSTDERTQVFIIQGAPERLSEFRKKLTVPEWERFTNQFHEAHIKLDTFELSRASYMEVPSRSPMLFGAEVMPATVIQRAISGNQSFELTPNGGRVAVSAGVRGEVVAPPVTQQLSNGTVVNVFHAIAPTSYYVLPPLPKERYVSLLQPMIYVVVDRPTGIVLLIGMHE